MLNTKNTRGFTLLEILLVVAAIGILAGIVIVAINPGKQLGETRNSQRRVDVNTILNAVYQYALDNSGALPAGITTTATEICTGGTATATCATDGLAALNQIVWDQNYLTAIPRDPSGTCATNGVCYEISKSANNRVTVSAPDAELGDVISVTR